MHEWDLFRVGGGGGARKFCCRLAFKILRTSFTESLIEFRAQK
jgi:hypothetical protein